MELAWWHWLVMGMVLVALEMLVPTFFLMWFGLGALLVGVVVLFATPGFAAQLVLWAVASLAMMGIWIKWFKVPDRNRAGQAKEGVIGIAGLLTRPVTDLGQGEILFQRPVLGSDRWPVVADNPIPAGAKAKVVDVLGQTLKVERMGG
ncbi:NfeD family protein [Parasulfuritortus cantonensis]|uniref:NfeD family protein n=1 Tax=Parasulfuritortus cantonensis TaxID=2528202 RepID=A0A4V2NWF4_9PROT|nr:NfeD family protein [Parasulfuritortus cantonensis]TCJ17132.1 NfeD family protein [Parasulfuritortus cantonensis]